MNAALGPASRTPDADADGALVASLARALLTPRDGAAMRALLADLCTPAELHALAERWHVAALLADGERSYRQIHDDTGVSTTTIVRVARFLNHEPNGGYRAALAAIAGKPDDVR